MTLPPPDNSLLKLPGRTKPRGQWKVSNSIQPSLKFGSVNGEKQHIIRHHSVLFHVASWKGCYWVFEGVLWYVRCSVPCERIKLMIWVNMCASALMPAPAGSVFLSEMFRTDGLGDQPWWVLWRSLQLTHVWKGAGFLFHLMEFLLVDVLKKKKKSRAWTCLGSSLISSFPPKV